MNFSPLRASNRSCDRWACGIVDSTLPWLAARSTGSADTAGTMVLHLAEPAATELADKLADGVHSCTRTHADPWGTCTAVCATHRSID